MGIMLGWAAAALIGGYLVLTRTGVSTSDRPGRRVRLRGLAS